MTDVVQNAPSSLVDGGFELPPGNRVFDLEYADDIALQRDDTQEVHHVLEYLTLEVPRYSMFCTF